MSAEPNPISNYLTLLKMEEDAKRLADQAQKARDSFREFVKMAWPVVEPSKALIPGAFHIDAICDHLQAVADRQIQNFICVVPPGSAKSMIVSVMFSAWMWINNPRWRVNCASYEEGLSTRDSVRCRDLITSQWYQDSFTPDWKLKSDQNEKTYYYNTQLGFRMSTTVEARGTGHRGHCTLIDDSLSTAARFSPVTLDRCVRWHDNVWFNRLIDMQTGSRIVIGQRVAENDLIGHLLRSGGWELLLIPMEYDPTRARVTSIGWKDPRKELGELMFEPLVSRRVADDLKKNAAVWATQYQGSPVVDGGGILKSEKWRYWQMAGMNLPPVKVRMEDGKVIDVPAVELPDSFDFVLQSWDFAFKDLKTSDFVAGAKVAVKAANRFVLTMVRERLDLPGSLTAVRQMSGSFPIAQVKLVEDKANGPAVIQMLKNEIPGIEEVTPEGGKVSRASAISPELNAGNWFLPHPSIAPWVGNPENPLEGGFLAEATAFPFGQHDDMCDVISQTGAYLQKRGNLGGVFGVTENQIICSPFDIGEKWPRLFGFCVHWREVGAVWIARRPESGEYYAYHEYNSNSMDPAQHAGEMKKAGAWVQGFMHADEFGRDERSGLAMVAKYRKVLGLQMNSIRNTGEAEIADLAEALGNGKLKLFGNLSRLLDQFRQFRRDDNGRLPQQNVAVIRALLVAWRAKDKAKGPAEPPKQDRMSSFHGQNQGSGWMAG